jgi:hypothetical protein
MSCRDTTREPSEPSSEQQAANSTHTREVEIKSVFDKAALVHRLLLLQTRGGAGRGGGRSGRRSLRKRKSDYRGRENASNVRKCTALRDVCHSAAAIFQLHNITRVMSPRAVRKLKPTCSSHGYSRRSPRGSYSIMNQPMALRMVSYFASSAAFASSRHSG